MPSVTNDNANDQGDAVLGFYAHFAIYMIANGTLLALNLLTGGPAWAVWPLIGWGLGLAAHGISVFFGAPHPRDGRVGS